MFESISTAKRLVVKIGSALLVDEESGRIRRDWLDALADDLKQHEMPVQMSWSSPPAQLPSAVGTLV